MSGGPAARDEHDALDAASTPAATLRLFGHGGPWRELIAAHRSGRLHHAWLLQGPRGIGKATAAFAFARYLLAAEESGGGDRPVASPDDPIARQIAQASHPNLVHITRPPVERGEGFKAQITVDEIRKLQRFFRTTTSGRQWRIAIVDPADDMNRNAANALLKILEEPPERSVFLITNHLPGRLLPTIRSRCRVLRLEGLSEEELAAALHAGSIGASESEVAGAVSLAEGGVRQAISLLAGGGLELDAQLNRIWQAPEADWQAIHMMADAVTQKGREAAFDFAAAGVFKRLAREAEPDQAAGKAASRRFAALWISESERFREGLAFNLDRKQLLLTFFRQLFAIRAGMADKARMAAGR